MIEAIKLRVFSNWTIVRAIYLIIGSVVIYESIMNQQWLGVLFGTYFASMGLFAFGCASGNCYGGNCELPKKNN